LRKIRRSQNGNVHTISPKEAYELADLIEKAVEVERKEWRKMLEEATCQESLQVGNAANMREALAAINCIDTRGLKYLLRQLVEADIFDGGQINRTISAVERAKRSLSTPPRNCDLYATEEEAWKAFYKVNPDAILSKYCLEQYQTWLFAEAKGEAK
jgi:hypothetical protein